MDQPLKRDNATAVRRYHVRPHEGRVWAHGDPIRLQFFPSAQESRVLGHGVIRTEDGVVHLFWIDLEGHVTETVPIRGGLADILGQPDPSRAQLLKFEESTPEGHLTVYAGALAGICVLTVADPATPAGDLALRSSWDIIADVTDDPSWREATMAQWIPGQIHAARMASHAPMPHG